MGAAKATVLGQSSVARFAVFAAIGALSGRRCVDAARERKTMRSNDFFKLSPDAVSHPMRRIVMIPAPRPAHSCAIGDASQVKRQSSA
jgi:hypothetical protein